MLGLDADIRSFFDSVDQQWLIRFLEHRIGDPRIIRLAQKWLKAGVLEDGTVTLSDRGTGQGSVISPLFANIYLHYVLDLWADRWRRREATGDMIIVRYADDVVAGFEHEDDARRFLDAMRTRFEEFALSLHPDKTRLIEFGRHAAARREKRGLGKPETFNFLGFTFICGKSRNGGFLLHRKSRGDRMRAKLQEIQEELRRRRHQAIPLQGEWLRRIVSGYFNYTLSTWEPENRLASRPRYQGVSEMRSFRVLTWTEYTMRCRRIVAPSRCSTTTSAGSGCAPYNGAAKRTARPGRG